MGTTCSENSLLLNENKYEMEFELIAIKLCIVIIECFDLRI